MPRQTNQELLQVAERLLKMRGPADGRGSYLGDGKPAQPEVKVRAFDLAAALQELVAWRTKYPNEGYDQDQVKPV